MEMIYPEVSFTKEWKEGRRFERERLTKIIDEFCFGDTEESIEIKRELNKLLAFCEEKN